VLSRLLIEVSIGGTNISAINKLGRIVCILSIAAIDGLLLGLKYIMMETCGMLWPLVVFIEYPDKVI
jgi:ATP-binding cassette, subfamily B (MDR/TAP), member 1